MATTPTLDDAALDDQSPDAGQDQSAPDTSFAGIADLKQDAAKRDPSASVKLPAGYQPISRDQALSALRVKPSAAPAGDEAKPDESLLGKMWRWANEGLIAKPTEEGVRQMAGVLTGTDPSRVAQEHPYITGATKAVGEFASGMTAPLNLALILGGPVLGTAGEIVGLSSKALGITSRALSGIFAAQAAAGVYQDAKAAHEAYKQGNNEEAARAVTDAVFNLGAGAFAGHHAAKGGYGFLKGHLEDRLYGKKPLPPPEAPGGPAAPAAPPKPPEPPRVAGRSAPLEEAGISIPTPAVPQEAGPGGPAAATEEAKPEEGRTYSTGGALQPEVTGPETQPETGKAVLTLEQELESPLLDQIAQHHDIETAVRGDLDALKIPREDWWDVVDALRQQGEDAFAKGNVREALKNAHHEIVLTRTLEEIMGMPREEAQARAKELAAATKPAAPAAEPTPAEAKAPEAPPAAAGPPPVEPAKPEAKPPKETPDAGQLPLFGQAGETAEPKLGHAGETAKKVATKKGKKPVVAPPVAAPAAAPVPAPAATETTAPVTEATPPVTKTTPTPATPARVPLVGPEVNNLAAEITNAMSPEEMLSELGVKKFIGDPRENLTPSQLARLLAIKRLGEEATAAAAKPEPPKWVPSRQAYEATAPEGYVGPDGEGAFVATRKQYKTQGAAKQAATKWLRGLKPAPPEAPAAAPTDEALEAAAKKAEEQDARRRQAPPEPPAPEPAPVIEPSEELKRLRAELETAKAEAHRVLKENPNNRSVASPQVAAIRPALDRLRDQYKKEHPEDPKMLGLDAWLGAAPEGQAVPGLWVAEPQRTGVSFGWSKKNNAYVVVDDGKLIGAYDDPEAAKAAAARRVAAKAAKPAASTPEAAPKPEPEAGQGIEPSPNLKSKRHYYDLASAKLAQIKAENPAGTPASRAQAAAVTKAFSALSRQYGIEHPEDTKQQGLAGWLAGPANGKIVLPVEEAAPEEAPAPEPTPAAKEPEPAPPQPPVGGVAGANKALKEAGYKEKIRRGRGYYYFTDGDAHGWYSSSIPGTNDISGWTPQQIIDERNRLAGEEAPGRGSGSAAGVTIAPKPGQTAAQSHAEAVAATKEENAAQAKGEIGFHRGERVVGANDHLMALLDRVAGRGDTDVDPSRHDWSNAITIHAAALEGIVSDLHDLAEVEPDAKDALDAVAKLLQTGTTGNGNVVVHRSSLGGLDRLLLEELFHDYQYKHGLAYPNNAAAIDAKMRMGASKNAWKGVVSHLVTKGYDFKTAIIEAPAWIAAGAHDTFKLEPHEAAQLLGDYLALAQKIAPDALTKLPPIHEALEGKVNEHDAIKERDIGKPAPEVSGGGGERDDSLQPAEDQAPAAAEPKTATGPAAAPAPEAVGEPVKPFVHVYPDGRRSEPQPMRQSDADFANKHGENWVPLDAAPTPESKPAAPAATEPPPAKPEEFKVKRIGTMNYEVPGTKVRVAYVDGAWRVFDGGAQVGDTYGDMGKAKDAAREHLAGKMPEQLFNKLAKETTETPEFQRWFGDSKVVDKDGEPLVVYHGTHGNIDKFKRTRGAHFGFHFGDREAANTRLEDTADKRLDKEGMDRQRKVSEQKYEALSKFESELRAKDQQVPPEELLAALKADEDGGVPAINDVLGRVFDKYAYKPTPEETRRLADLREDYERSKQPIMPFGVGANIGAYFLRARRLLRMPDVKTWQNVKAIREALPFDSDARTLGELEEDVRGHGYDGIVYKNMVENPVMRTDSYIVFDPTQIKSAIGNRGTFDPEHPGILQSKMEPQRERTEQGDDWLSRSAQSYMARRGSPSHEAPPGTRDARAMEIADAYAAMKHEPEAPAVKAAYAAMKLDLDDQWNHAVESGVTFEPWTQDGQPYADSPAMTADVRNNHHLYFFLGGDMPADHPLAEVDPKTGYTYNDKLRAVHDLYGHAVHGWQFGERGEENAWITHSRMFSRAAAPALTSETKGQNNWVNFGPHMRRADGTLIKKGEPGWKPATERPFAEQKAGLLPRRFHYRIDAPISFVSPNTIDIPSATEAEKQFKSDIHNRFVDQAHALADDMGLRVVIESAVGSWEGGAENSLAVHYPFGTDPELVKYYEANLGRLAYQYAVARFIPDVNGKDTLHHLWVDGKKADSNEIANLLLKNGIANSTIIPAEDGYIVNLIDTGDELADNIRKVKTELGVKSGGHNRGAAEFPGNYTDRDAAEQDFVRTIEEVESGRPSLRGLRGAFESRPDYDILYRAIREAQGPVAPEAPPAGPADLNTLKAEAADRMPPTLQSKKAAAEDETPPRGSTVHMMDPDILQPHYKTIDAMAEDLEYNTRRGLKQLFPGDAPREHRAMVNRAVNIARDELKYQLAQENSGANWYKDDIRTLMGQMQKLHPELEHWSKESLFLLFTAATSPGKTAAFDNLNVAEQAYNLYKKTGRVPLHQPDGTPWGTYGNAPLVTMKALLKHFKGDEGKAMEWMLTKHPVDEVRAMKAKSGFQPDTVDNALPPDYDPNAVFGSYILGEKVGPFFMNLNGISTELTVDRWFMRTWNRMMGTLVSPEGEIQDLPRGKNERAAMIEAIGELEKEFGLETSQIQAALWYYEQGLYTRLGKKGVFGGTYANAAQEVYDLRSGGHASRGEAYAAGWDDADAVRARRRARTTPTKIRGKDIGGAGEGQTGSLFGDEPDVGMQPAALQSKKAISLEEAQAEFKRRQPKRSLRELVVGY